MSKNLLLENLTKTFGTLVAVNGINLEIREGEFICLLGPSGCGKTTILRMITGFEAPTEGKVACAWRAPQPPEQYLNWWTTATDR